MKRKLTFAMLLSLSAASPLVQALGLADAEVRSTLDAPLRATIPVTDAGHLRPESLKVSIADTRAFRAAGLERTPLAASVNLDIRRRQDGLVLEVSTRRAVREPWLDLLLRFEWPGGQQLREVTLLLDPPDYDQMPALVSGSRPEAASASSFDRQAELQPPARVSSLGAPSAGEVAAEPSSSGPAWVRPGDTLWAVAGRLRPNAGISRPQMMIALVEANPDAFVAGNIHGLRAGYRLAVPSREAILSRSNAEASRVVEAMTRGWARREEGAPVEEHAEGGGDVSATAGMADVEVPVQPTSKEKPAVARGSVGPRLTLLTEAEANVEAPAAGAPVSGGDAQRPGEASRLDPEVLEVLYGWGEPGPEARLWRLEQRWQESRDALAQARAERDALQETLGEMRQELDTLRGQVAVLNAADAPTLLSAQEAPSPAWWSRIVSSGEWRSLMLGGAGVVALLALLAWVRRRRRREEAPQAVFGPSRPVGPPSVGTAVPDGSSASPAQASMSQSSMPRSSMPQAEAINEADIFIAYGRHDQARRLLEASLEHEPERDDLRLKLLGVQLEQGDRQAASQEAARLRARGEPAILAEVERLLARRPEAPSEPAGAPEDADPSSRQTPVPPDPAGAPAAGAPAAARPVVPEASPGQADHDEATPPEVAGASRRTPASSSSNDPEPGPLAPADKPAHTMSPRRDTPAPDIIDYRPPALDPSPAAREETPMQPSVEFPAGGAGTRDAGTRGATTKEAVSESERSQAPEGALSAMSQIADLEVEEVAFPPLERDNTPSRAAASSSSALAEARRLIDVEASGQARAMLESLIDESDDPQARQEARELLDHLQY